MQSQDYDLAAGLIEEIWVGHSQQTPSGHLLRIWLTQIPPSILQQYPRLLILYVTFNLKAEAGEAELAALASQFNRENLTQAERENLSVIKAYQSLLFLQQGNCEGANQAILEALDQVDEESAVILGRNYCIQALLHVRGDGNLIIAEKCLHKTMPLQNATGIPGGTVWLPTLFGQVALLKGQLGAAENCFLHALNAAAETSEKRQTYGHLPLLGLSKVCLRQARLDEADTYAEEAYALPIAYETDLVLPEFHLDRIATLMMCRLMRQKEPDIAGLMIELDQYIGENTSTYLTRLGTATKARLALALGMLNQADGWQQKAQHSQAEPFRSIYFFEQLTLARCEYMQKRFDVATARLAALRSLDETVNEISDWNDINLELWVLNAMLLQSQNKSAALESLQQALTLGEPEEYISIFVVEGQPMAELLTLARVSGIAPDYISETGKAIKTKSTFSQETGVAINIDAPPERIWSLFTTSSEIPKWTSTVSSVEGQIAEGEKVKLTVPYAPGRTFNLTVHEVVPEKKLVWGDGMAPMFKVVRTYTLSANHDGSTDFSMVEVISGIMLPMISGSLPDFAPPFEQYAADLKRTAEAGNGHS